MDDDLYCFGLFYAPWFLFLRNRFDASKNTINILFKNFFVITVGLLLYAIGGFNLMYPGFEEGATGFFKFAGFGIGAPEGGMTPPMPMADTHGGQISFPRNVRRNSCYYCFWSSSRTIKLSAFMLFAILYVGLVYPIVGSWKWGGGFLDGMGFYDFAGSTLVHSVGGWAALIAIYLLGARIGRSIKTVSH